MDQHANLPSRTFANPDMVPGMDNEIRSFYSELSKERAAARFSIARVFREMRAGGLRDGYEREVCGAFALLLGRTHDMNRVVVPWPALACRDLTAAVASGGGYLVGTDRGPLYDVLRGWSIVVDGGADVQQLKGNLTLPRVTGAMTATSLPNEASGATESQPILGQAVLTPKAVSLYLEHSWLMGKLTPDLEPMLRRILVGQAGATIDSLTFAGTGASGQPTGIINTAGVGVISGTSLGWTGVRGLRKGAIAGGAMDGRLQFAAGATAQDLLLSREKFTGAGPIWDDSGYIAGCRALGTNRMPTDAIVCGDFSQIVIGMWGALEIEINPYANFTAGISGVRLFFHMDVALPHPECFAVSTSVT